MKKREFIMLLVLVIMCIFTVALFQMTQIPQETEEISRPNIDLPLTEGITKEKEQRIYQYLEEKIGINPIKGITILENQNSIIETDGCNRYYAEMNVIGVNKNHEIDIYTYCIIIQENSLGEFYVMPYGFEIIEADTEPLKKDILTSTMKVVNEWGMKPSGQKRQNIYRSASEQWDFETFFEMQKISKLIVEFIDAYSSALTRKDFEEVASYFKEDTPYYRKQEKEFNNLIQTSYYCDLREIQIMDVAISRGDGSFFVTLKGGLYIYVDQGILKKDFHKTYKVTLENDQAIILGDRVIQEFN